MAAAGADLPDKGLAQLSEALAEAPHSAELHEGLILSLVYLDRIEDAAKAANQKLDAIPDFSR
jgi:hypothetical protein